MPLHYYYCIHSAQYWTKCCLSYSSSVSAPFTFVLFWQLISFFFSCYRMFWNTADICCHLIYFIFKSQIKSLTKGTCRMWWWVWRRLFIKRLLSTARYTWVPSVVIPPVFLEANISWLLSFSIKKDSTD